MDLQVTARITDRRKIAKRLSFCRRHKLNIFPEHQQKNQYLSDF
jgi:hypothetical protein